MARSDMASQLVQASDAVFAPKAQPSRPLAAVVPSQSSDGLALLLAAANDTTDAGRESPRRGDSAQARLQHGVHRVSPASSAPRPASSSSSRVKISGQDRQGKPVSPTRGDGSTQLPVAMMAAPFHHHQPASSSAITSRVSPALAHTGIGAMHPPHISATSADASDAMTRSRDSFPVSVSSPDAFRPRSSPMSSSTYSALQHPVPTAAPTHSLLHPAGSVVAPLPRSTPPHTGTMMGSTSLLHGLSFLSGSPAVHIQNQSQQQQRMHHPPAQQQQQQQQQGHRQPLGLHSQSYWQHQRVSAAPSRPAWAGDSQPLPGGVGTVTPVFLITLRAGGGQHILRADEFDSLLTDLSSAAEASASSAPLSDAAVSAVLRANTGSAVSGLSPQASASLLSGGVSNTMLKGQSRFATPKLAHEGTWHTSQGKTPARSRGLVPPTDLESGDRTWRGRAARTPATVLVGGGFNGDRGTASSRRPQSQQGSRGGLRQGGARKRSRSRRFASSVAVGESMDGHESETGLNKRYIGVDDDAVGVVSGADRFGGRGYAIDGRQGEHSQQNDADDDEADDDDDDDEDFPSTARGRAAATGRGGKRRGGRRRQRTTALQTPRSADSNSTTTSTAAVVSDDSGHSQPAYATRHARAARKDSRQSGSTATYGTGTGSGAASTPPASSAVSAASSASASSGARGGRQRTGEYITSTFRGVYGRSSAKASGVRWAAHASDGKRKVHLGYFNSAEEAAVAYDTAVMRFKGPTAITNFRYDARGNRVDA